MAHQTSTQPLSILTDVPLVLDKVYLVNCAPYKGNVSYAQGELGSAQQGIAALRQPPIPPKVQTLGFPEANYESPHTHGHASPGRPGHQPG